MSLLFAAANETSDNTCSELLTKGLGAPLPSDANLVVGYTPPSPLPTYTDSQIVQALRTSWLGPANSAGDYPQDTRTFDWTPDINDTIWFRLVTTSTVVTSGTGVSAATTTRDNMSVQEQARITEALRIWDDFIDMKIANDQLAGTPGHTNSFFDIFYVSTGTTSLDGTNNGDTSGRAFANNTNMTTRADPNVYGTASVQIINANLNLGRSFNGGELDGRNAAGVLDGGVFDLSYGQRGFETILHETGHALGLSHPGFYNFGAVTPANGQLFAQDNLRNTIMSYNSEVSATTNFRGINASTPMVYDILAIQSIYGADLLTRTGNDTYGFNNTTGRTAFDFKNTTGSVFAIYDAGGQDTIDASGFSSDSVIRLEAGSYSSIGRSLGDAGGLMLENIGIAFDTIIENATGGAGADTISGNFASNILRGNAGDDILYGLNGNDILIGGTGSDYMDGGAGADRISYEDSPTEVQIDLSIGKAVGGTATGDTLVSIERITGSAFDDSLRGNDQANTIFGGNGNDNIDGGAGVDILLGEAGDDILQGGAGGDFLYGDIGFDVSTYSAAVTINLATNVHTGEAAGDSYTGIDQYNGSPEADTMIASDLYGARFAGGDGADTFYGGTQDDWFQGGKGVDYISGGAGSDLTSYADAPNAIIADMTFTDGNTDGKIVAGEWGTDTLVSIEDVEGTAFDDTLYGDERNNKLYGLGGNDDLQGDYNGGSSADLLDGGAGNDILDGGAGADQLFGGTGNDTYYVDSDLDQVRDYVGEGNDTVVASATFHLHQQLAEIEVLLTNDAASTAAINLYGSDHSNTIIGNAGANTLSGRGGDDFLYTGAGADIMDGGDGFDTIVFSKAMVADWQSGILDSDISTDSWISWEAIRGSAGDDRIRTNSWGYAVELHGRAGNDVLAAGVAGVEADRLFGDAGNDELSGGAGDDYLNGGKGRDVMLGGAGNDLYIVDSTGDKVDEGAAGSGGTDTVRSSVSFSLTLSAKVSGRLENLVLLGTAADGAGNVAANVITGNAQANTLMGRGGADVLNGANGADILDGGTGIDQCDGGRAADKLTGGTGRDILTGGTGNDRFIYNATNEGKDTITDFSSASAGDNDRFEFLGSAFGGHAAGGLAANQFQVSNADTAGKANVRFFFEQDTGILRFDDDGNGAHAAVIIATLQAGATMTIDDIRIV